MICASKALVAAAGRKVRHPWSVVRDLLPVELVVVVVVPVVVLVVLARVALAVVVAVTKALFAMRPKASLLAIWETSALLTPNPAS